MKFFKLFSKSKSVLGVDIGTSNIKIAQISHNKSPILETYGMVNIAHQIGGNLNIGVIEQMASVLKTLILKANVSTKKCIISFPNSAVFSSVIELPQMSESEIGSAVEFEAKKYVPLALSEVNLSWTVIAKGKQGTMDKQKILLAALPKQITENYSKVFDLAGLDIRAGDIEAMALIRSLIGNAPINCVIIDIGAKSTGLNIIEKGLLKLSRNINVGGDTMTNRIAKSLNITHSRAEQFKKDFGMSSSTFIPDSIKPVLTQIKNEVQKLLTIFQSQSAKVDKILLVGGGSNLPGIVDFFGELGVPVEIGNPFQVVGYDRNVEKILKRYSLNLPVAIGLALRED